MSNKTDLKILYKNYGKTPDKEIASIAKRIELVESKNGVYTAYNRNTLKKIIKNPRGHSVNFDLNGEPNAKNMDHLTPFKTLQFLVKSSSRFFLKADLGEIVDQMTNEDKKSVKALRFVEGSNSVINGSEGEHFVMEVELLKIDPKKSKIRVLLGKHLKKGSAGMALALTYASSPKATIHMDPDFTKSLLKDLGAGLPKALEEAKNKIKEKNKTK